MNTKRFHHFCTRVLAAVALLLLVLATSGARAGNNGGSLVLDPAKYQALGENLNASQSLEFDFSAPEQPKMIVDGAAAYTGVHDALTDWNVFTFKDVQMIGISVSIRASSNAVERAGDPIAILSQGDLRCSTTLLSLKGMGWKGGTNKAYGPGGGSFSQGGAYGGMREFSGTVGFAYNVGAPDGDLLYLFEIASPLGSGGGGLTAEAGSNGGGALQLTAAGKLSVTGQIDVSGNFRNGDGYNNNYGGGSGGTLILACGGQFDDQGLTARANGGVPEREDYAGTGGRIAIYYNQGARGGHYEAVSGQYDFYARGTRYAKGPNGYPFATSQGKTYTIQANLQGMIGRAIADGEYAVSLRFFDAANGGGVARSDWQTMAQVAGGCLSMEVPFEESFFRLHDRVFVEVWIDLNHNGLDNGDRISQRLKITSVLLAE